MVQCVCLCEWERESKMLEFDTFGNIMLHGLTWVCGAKRTYRHHTCSSLYPAHATLQDTKKCECETVWSVTSLKMNEPICTSSFLRVHVCQEKTSSFIPVLIMVWCAENLRVTSYKVPWFSGTGLKCLGIPKLRFVSHKYPLGLKHVRFCQVHCVV